MVSGYNAPITAPIFGTGLPEFNPYPSGGGGAWFPSSSPTVPGANNPNALIAPQQNLESLPDITALTEAINALNLQAQQAANMGRIPGEQGLEQQSSNLIGQQMQGQVPADVQNLLRQQGAEQNVSTGRDSQTAYLRALGLTSLGQQQQGQQNLSAAVARNPVAPLFDPTHMLITPYQQGMLGLEQARIAAGLTNRLAPRMSGGGGGGYSGAGGTAMGPVATNPNLGSMLFPQTTQSGGGGYVPPEDFATSFENAFGVPWEDPNAVQPMISDFGIDNYLNPELPYQYDMSGETTYDPLAGFGDLGFGGGY